MLTDTHTHLDFPDFAADLDAVLARAEAAGVKRLITIGTTLEGSRRALDLAKRYPQVWATVGVHPSNADEAPDDVMTRLRELARHPKVVALGECGLDYHRLPSKNLVKPHHSWQNDPREVEASVHDGGYKAKQAAIFDQQLDLAVELGLNVVIHERDAWDDTLNLLRPYQGRLRAVFHCFGKSPDHARQVLDLGFLVSFTGIVTFKNAGPVKETVGALPSGAYMVETDCPFLAPVPYRGKRCEPTHVRNVAEDIARMRGVPLEQIAAETEATANTFFRFATA
jgi:TatD DNase family protein